MENKYFIRISENSFNFLIEGINDIQDTDIEITEKEYKDFFKLQSQGKQFKLKEISTGKGLFDYIEEFKREQIINNTPTLEERISALEMAMLENLLS